MFRKVLWCLMPFAAAVFLPAFMLLSLYVFALVSGIENDMGAALGYSAIFYGVPTAAAVGFVGGVFVLIIISIRNAMKNPIHTNDRWPCACVKRDKAGNLKAIKLHPATSKKCNKCGAERPEKESA